MKHSIIIHRLCLFLFILMLAAPAWSEEITISSKEDWKAFCERVNKGKERLLDVKLTQDVDLGSEIVMLGAQYHDYVGTFDGQGHTLKFNWNAGSVDYIAPFGHAAGTIKNLHVKGKIKSTKGHLSGLVYLGMGSLYVDNCIIDVDLETSAKDYSRLTGVVSFAYDMTHVTITNCVVKGKFTAFTAEAKKNMSGFVGTKLLDGWYTLYNCLYLGSNNATNESHTFGPEINAGNCYYLNTCGKAQCDKVTEAQLKNGEVAYLLQRGDETHWGQTLGTDNEPIPTNDAKKQVYRVEFAYKGQVKAKLYATSGQHVFGTLPTVKEVLGTDYNAQNTYIPVFSDGFSASTPVNGSRTVDVTMVVNNNYEITSKSDWLAFCYLVNRGQNAVNAKMTKDIDLGEDIWQVGTDRRYSGTFDGQNHTLKINWNSGSKTWIAPFQTVDGATIKNLRTEGEIKSSTHFLSGLIQEAYGTTTISNCVSAVNITSSYDNGGCDVAGMIECVRDNANVTITDCVVKGKFHATTEKGRRDMSGFIENQYGKCTLNNCLYIGENNATTTGGYTFASNYSSGSTLTLNNCYYLNACGKAQGTRITADQLKNGEVAYLLQNKRAGNFWGQELGTENEPQPTAKAEKHVYKVDFIYNNQVKASRYANSGKTVSLPTLQDILGTDYDEHHYYTGFAFADGFNGSTTISGDRAVRVYLTKKDAYEIGSKDDWKTFCDLVSGGHTKLDAKMTANVDLGGDIKTIGDGVHKYSGTFDGQGHTLTLNWDAGTAHWKSPFYSVDGCTINKLRVKGSIKSDGKGHAGLIQNAYGTVAVSNCVSDVDITCGYSTDACSAAGMIQWVGGDAKVTFNDCLVKGSINAKDAGRKGMAGFVYNQNGTCTFNNCLYLGTNNATGGSNTFTYNATTNNCYYLNVCDVAQGTKVTLDQLMSGEVAYKLQNGRSTQFWGQTLRTDDEPQLTDDAKKRVYEVKFSYNGNVVATRYATQGKAIYGALPNESDLLGALYDPAKNYSLTFDGGFNTGTAIDKDRTVAVTILVNNNFEIATKDDWKEFCRLVNSGKTKLDAKMIKDVNLEGDIAMVGTNDHKYAGTFDGQNHTLTFDWNGGNNKNTAPFRSADGATIRNLRTKGKIVSKNNWLSGLIDESYGNITISNCVSDVALTSSHNDNVCGAAGMISYIYKGDVTITDCVVKGSINATTGTGQKGMGGFVYAQLGTCTLTNCLYIATNNADNTNSDCHTFAKNATVTNCYYLNACGTAQGIKITEEQLKSGEVARLLQGDRTDQFWGQNLGTDNEPQLTDDAAKHVYKVDFTYNGNAAAARYANKGGHIFGALPTAQNLLGMAYSHSYYYALTCADDFSANTAVDADRTVAVTIARKAIDEELEIASKDDWKIFCDAVSRGKRNFDVKMTADVDLGKDIIMVGEHLLVYSGTFDGQGHTLKIDWNAGTQNEIAPFKYLGETTIKNLTVKGRINADGYKLAGMVVNAMSSLNVSNCVSDVDITSDYDGESHMGGIVNYVFHNAQSVRFIDCIVKGKLHATKEAGRKSMGGFIGYRGGNMPCYFENCLYIGENNAIVGLDGYTFGPNPVLTNSHYLKVCGVAQGEQVTEKQLKNGHVSELLQVDRKDACHWAQVLGDMPSLYREADKAKPNYIYYDTANKRWTCDDFRLTDGKPLPIGLDFLAAKATYERDFTAGKATVCLPYDLPVSGFKAYTLSEKQDNANAVHFTPVNDKLEVYKPYLLVADGTVQLGGENIEVRFFKDDNLKTTVATGHSMTGTVDGMDNATAAAANAYILQLDGLFHKVTAGNASAMVPANHAYVTCPKTSGAKQLSIILDGETTGIRGVTNDTANGPVYDLQGRRVADRLDDNARHQLPAGVYIVNGRKVIVK